MMRHPVLLLVASVVLVYCVFGPSATAYMTGPFSSNETLVGENFTTIFTEVPNLYFNFHRRDGTILPNASETYKLISLHEVDNATGTAIENGNPVYVQTLYFNDTNLVWTEDVALLTDASGNAYKNINYSTTFPNGVGFTVGYYYFPSAYVVDYPYINQTFLLPPGTFKFSIWIKNWQPVDPSNLFLIRINSGAKPYFVPVIHALIGHRWQVLVDIGSNLVQQFLNFVDTAVVDGVPQSLNWYAEYIGLSTSPFVTIQGFKLYFYFPNWNNSLFYDPDLTVLVLDQGTGSSDNSGSDTQTILIAVLVPTLVVGALLVVIVAGVVTLFLMRGRLWKVRKRLTQMNRATEGMEAEHMPD